MKLEFPTNSTTYEAPNGVKYVFANGFWSQELNADDYFGERYVLVAGDTMTGSLSSPAFSGNINVIGLDSLPNITN